MVLLSRPFFPSSMADNINAFRCFSVIYPHLLLSPSHFQHSLSTLSIERVDGIPLQDFCASDFQRGLKITIFQKALKIIIIAELFIVIALRSSRQEATAEQSKLMAAHMKFFLRCGGRNHGFSIINTFAEMNELHHNGAQFKLKYGAGG